MYSSLGHGPDTPCCLHPDTLGSDCVHTHKWGGREREEKQTHRISLFIHFLYTCFTYQTYVCLCVCYQSPSRVTHCSSAFIKYSHPVNDHTQWDKLENTSQTVNTFTMYLSPLSMIITFTWWLLTVSYTLVYTIKMTSQQIHYITLCVR